VTETTLLSQDDSDWNASSSNFYIQHGVPPGIREDSTEPLQLSLSQGI